MAKAPMLRGSTFGKEGLKEPVGYSMVVLATVCSKLKSRTVFRILRFVSGGLAG